MQGQKIPLCYKKKEEGSELSWKVTSASDVWPRARNQCREWRGAVSEIERNPRDYGVSQDKKMVQEGEVVPLCQTLLNNQEETGAWLVDSPE